MLTLLKCIIDKNNLTQFKVMNFQRHNDPVSQYIVVDVNECATDNGGCNQTCTNLVGGFSCECYNGYQQDGISCDVPGMKSTI